MIMSPKRLTPENHAKAWGHEKWACNNEEFCGKILTIKSGCKFSMHFHRDKLEVFYVLSGTVDLHWIQVETARTYVMHLKPGDTVEIPRLQPHQLHALEDAQVIEFSTHHEDSDSYRVAPGDSQKA